MFVGIRIFCALHFIYHKKRKLPIQLTIFRNRRTKQLPKLSIFRLRTEKINHRLWIFFVRAPDVIIRLHVDNYPTVSSHWGTRCAFAFHTFQSWKGNTLLAQRLFSAKEGQRPKKFWNSFCLRNSFSNERPLFNLSFKLIGSVLKKFYIRYIGIFGFLCCKQGLAFKSSVTKGH